MAHVGTGRVVAAVRTAEKGETDLRAIDPLAAEEGAQVEDVSPFLHHHPELREVLGVLARHVPGP
eukprot:350931-Alexandrium_andersonii.AAC.1